MDGVLEHVVDEVGIWFDEVVQHLQLFDLLPFVVIEQIEVDLITVQFHVLHRVNQVLLLFTYLFISLPQLFLLLLQLPNLFIDLFFHHLIQILLLDVKLLHYSAEGLLQPVNFFVELFSHFELQLRVQLLSGWGFLL